MRLLRLLDYTFFLLRSLSALGALALKVKCVKQMVEGHCLLTNEHEALISSFELIHSYCQSSFVEWGGGFSRPRRLDDVQIHAFVRSVVGEGEASAPP